MILTPEIISTIENALDNKSDFYHDRYPYDDPIFVDGMAKVKAAQQAIHEFSDTDLRTVYIVLCETKAMGVTVTEINSVYLDKKAAEAQVDKMAYEAGLGDPRDAGTYYVEDFKLHLPWEYRYE